MIMMEQPSLSLNSDDVPGPKYAMWRTVTMPAGITPTQVIGQIIVTNKVAMTVLGSPLANVIINCHGYEGGQGLSTGGHGKPGFTLANVSLFGLLANVNIGPIWLVACQAARGAAGNQFCQALANAARTVVIAGEDNQRLSLWQTVRYHTGAPGQIDEYEGVVYIFYPNGTFIRGIDPEEFMWTVKV